MPDPGNDQPGAPVPTDQGAPGVPPGSPAPTAPATPATPASPAEQMVELEDGTKVPLSEARELISKGTDYTQKTQQLARDREEFERTRGAKTAEDQLPEDVKKQREADREYFKSLGYKTEDEVEKLVNDRMAERDKAEAIKQQDAALDTTFKELEKEYDGSDGRPKFDRKAILKHGQQSGIFNPLAAYRDLHHNELQEWAVTQARTGARGTRTERAGTPRGGTQPAPAPAPKTWEEAEARASARTE